MKQMDIGKEKRTIRVEPLTSPVPAKTDEPARETRPLRAPQKEPAKPSPGRTPARPKVPAK